MSLNNQADPFARALVVGIQSEVSRIAEEEIARAQEAIAARTRASLARITLTLLDDFSLNRMGPELVITVRNPK